LNFKKTMETITLESQSLLDIALQETGTIEGIFDLAVANDLSLTDALVPGQKLSGTAVLNKGIQDYYTAKGITPATGDVTLLGGIGYMAVGIDFVSG
jgi:hypothetical protein